MGCSYSPISTQKLFHFSVSFLFLLISSMTHLRYMAEGRANLKHVAFNSQTVLEEKDILRAQIGSRPPRCARRCKSCGHCEAIQVPANPQFKKHKKNGSTVSGIAYSRGDDENSNYKPMTWKCKCGNLIFNP